MKKLIVFGAIIALFISCSEDDSNQNQNEEFFAVAEGNIWVYKRYNVSSMGEETVSNRVDSVRVTGQQVVDGNTYFNFNHKVYHSGNFSEESNELLRVDENEHLVNQDGLVIHPGTDAEYRFTFTRPQMMGSSTYRLEETENLTIEGQTYTVSPYVGYYTPNPGVNFPEGVGELIGYQQGVGKVVHRCRYTSSTAYYEDRLVYYELN